MRTKQNNKKICTTIFLVLFLLSLTFIAIPVKAQVIYIYTLTGPYAQSTESISSTDTIKIEMINVNGTGGYYATYMYLGAESQTIVSTTPITYFNWNASSILNYTASIWPNPDSFGVQAYRFFIVEPGVPTYLYTFPVTDFVGMSKAYISNYNIYGVIEEQFPLANINNPTFIMPQFQSYKITIVCDQGIYTQSFMAQNQLSNNLIVLAGAFNNTNPQNISIANAYRTTPTNLQIKYNDPDSKTDLLKVTVSHNVNGAAINDLVDTTVTNNYLYNLVVDNATDYSIRVEATRYGTVMEWDLISVAPLGYTNPFTGLLDFLGTWPGGFNPSQLIGVVIIAMFLVIGSFRTSGVSCLLACFVAGIMSAIGWFTIGLPMLVLSIVVSILVLLDEAKQTAREA